MKNELRLLAEGSARDLRNLQIKLTYLGTQKKPVPTNVFTTYFHKIDMDWFLAMRTHGLHYGNDEIAVWNFTVSPDQMKMVVDALLEGIDTWGTVGVMSPCLSLMLALRESRLGQSACEALLDKESTLNVTATIRDALAAGGNALGRDLVNKQRQMIAEAMG